MKGGYSGFVLLFAALSTLGQAQEWYTNHYTVPPTFAFNASKTEQSEIEVLESAGLTLPEGSEAVFDPDSSSLFIKTTPDEMELVEAFVESIIQPPKDLQILIHIIFIHSNGLLWETDSIYSPARPAKPTLETSQTIETHTYRQGKEAELLSFLTAPDISHPVSANRNVSGVFAVDQFKHMIEEAKAKVAMRVYAAPHVLMQNGQSASVRVSDLAAGVTGKVADSDQRLSLKIYIRSPNGQFGQPRKFSHCKIEIRDGDMITLVDRIDQNYLTTVIKGDLVGPDGSLHREQRADKLIEEGSPPPGLTIEDLQKLSQADELALAGTKYLKAGLIDEAEKQLRGALKILPGHPLTKNRENAYLNLWLRTFRSLPE